MPPVCLDERSADPLSELSIDNDSQSPSEVSVESKRVSLGGAVVVLMTLTVLQRVLGLVRNVLVCRWLEPSDLGLWNLANGFLILAAPLVVLGIPGSFNRYLSHYEQRNQLRSFLRRTLSASALLGLLGVLVLLAGRPIWSWLAFGRDASPSLFISATVTLVFVIGFNTCTELLTALRCVRAGAVFQTINGVLFTVFAIVLVQVVQAGGLGVVWGYGLSSAVTGVLMAAYLFRQRGDALAEEGEQGAEPWQPFWSRLLQFSLWFWLTDLLANLFSAIDRYMIVHTTGLSAEASLTMIGQYHSSQILGTLLVSFMAMLGSMLLSYCSHDWESGRRDRVEQTLTLALKLLSLTLTAGSALAILIAPWIFRMALADKYNDGLQVLPATMAYCIWFGLMFIAKIYLWCRERAAWATVGLAIGLVTNVVLNLWWLPMWGLQGAVLATVVANGVALAIVMTVAQGLGLRCSLPLVACLVCPVLLCVHAHLAWLCVAFLLAWGSGTGWLWTVEERETLSQWLASRGVRRRVVAANGAL